MTPSELAKVAEWLGVSIEHNSCCHTAWLPYIASTPDYRRAWSDADLTMALLEKLEEKGWRVALNDDGPDCGPNRYWCEGTRYGEIELGIARAGPSWLDAVVAAVMEVVK